MAMKRSANDMEQARSRPRRETAKRPRLSPTTEDNSSDPSSCSVSIDSALQSSPPLSKHTRNSSISSIRSPDDENESDETVSSSTSSDSSDDDESEAIITIGGPRKPNISSSLYSDGAEDLRSRLDSLLPQLSAANDVLTSEQDLFNMEDMDEDDQHIEMNLGLGVLEEQDSEDDSSSEDSDESSVAYGNDDTEHGHDPSSQARVAKHTKAHEAPDAMSKLLGKPMDRRKIGIEYLDTDDR